MSDIASPTPTPTPAPIPTPPAISKPTESRLRRWRRRLTFALVAVVLIAVIGRGIVNLVLPMILNRIASRYDLNVNYERSEIYLSSASVGLWHLKLTPRTDSASAIDVGYCRGDVSLLNLLKGNIVVYRAEADGVDARLERMENGDCPLLTRLLAGPQAKPQATPAATAAAQRDLDLDPPIRIDSLRASQIRAHITDLSVTPKVDTQLNVSLRLSDVGSTKRPVTFSLDATSPPLLDSMRVEGTGVAHGKKLDATMQVIVRGVHAKPAAGYLAALGLSPSGESISLRMSAAVKTEEFATAAPASAAGATTQPTGMKGSIVLADIAAVVDGVEAAGLDKLTIGIDHLMFDQIRLGTVTIENVRAVAKRTPEGTLRVAGIDLVGAPPSTATPPPSQPIALPAWSVKELSVHNVKASFEDAAVTPAAKLAIVVDHAGVKNLASDGSDLPTEIALQMSVPGIAESVHASGTAKPLAAKKTLELKIAAEGIKPDALRPYLDSAGFESQLKNGALTCDLSASLAQSPDGKLAADAKLANVKFTDGSDLFVFAGVTLAGAAIDPKANRIRVESIDVTGPTMSARRDKAGLVAALGLIQKTPAAGAAPAVVTPVATTRPAAPVAVASAGASSPPPLKLEIGKFSWQGAALRFDDQAVSPPVTVALGDTGVEASDLSIDLDPKAAAGTPGKFRAWLSAPGVAGKIAVNGTLAPTLDALTLEVDLDGQQLRAGPLTAYLQALGIKPELRDGSIHSHAHIALAHRNGEFTADVAVTGVKYADGKDELAGVDGLRISGATLHPDGISVNEIVIDKPRGRAMRDADGTFVVGGARLLAAATQPTATASTAVPTTGPAISKAPLAKPPVIVVSKLRINDGGLVWIDRAVPKPVNASARASVQLDNFVFGKAAEPAKLQITAVVPETIQTVTVTGVVSAALDAPMAKLDVVATGIQQGWVASYLPPGMQMNLADGRFRVKLDAAAPVAKEGGRQVRLVVTDLDYRDGPQGQPLLKFDSAKVLASRVDPVDGKTIAIDEISLAGLETGARKASDGTIRALGLTIGAPPPRQTTFAGAEPAAQTAVAKIPPPAPAAAPTTNVAELMAQERTPLPLITLAKLDINLRKVSYIDETRPEASPIDLADIKIRNRKPIEALGRDAQSHPPIEIETTGRIDPVVQSFTVAAVTAPFASQPTFVLDINATGIKGDGIIAAIPELKSQIDGSGLTDGRFTTHLESAAKFSRRGPLRYDFTKPFDAEFTIRPLEYRGTPDGPILAGLEEIRGEGIHVDPAKGGVIVRTLELTKPMGNVWRDKEGIHVLGLVLKVETPPATTTQPAEEPSLTVKTPVKVPQVAAAATTKPSAEIRIDRLLISGIDFRAEDRTTTPNLLLPLTTLDLEARNLSNMAMYEDRPIRFNVVAGAGKVPLAARGERELFSEVAANGNVSLYPSPRGYTKASVSGFEMLGIAGPANAQKVQIGGGVFDGTFDVRFEDKGVIDTRSRLALTDLKISEPPNGPIQSSLKLNVPLDAVILVLQDASGAITLPLHVPIKQGEVSTGAIVGSAAGAAAPIVGTAVASSPLKVAGGVTSMIGLGPKEKETGSRAAGEAAFAPADTQLSAAAQAQVNALIEQMRRQSKLELTLKSELGGADLARAAVLANPSPADCTEIAEQIRTRKGRLMQSRQQLAATARAQLASGDNGSAQMTIEELRGIDRELAAAEDALDRVYDLLRPGADRQADRRTRAAALYIAQQRLDAVRAALLSAGVPAMDQRIRVTRAQFAEPEKADSEGRITFTVLEKKKP